MHNGNRARWLALAVVCTGSLMNVLDTTIVGVALPAIKNDLGFTQASLAWVINAYLLTYGGFLLLGGRLGDLIGHRRLFTAGTAAFTFASLACGLAPGQPVLLAARAVQGLGGAVASAVALSLIVSLFAEPAERAKAMGIFGLVAAGGGSIGVLLGGVLTSLLSWHWIFLVNVPIGVAVCVAALRVLPAAPAAEHRGRLDIAGAVLVTSAVMLAVYAIVASSQAGWRAIGTGGALAGAALLLAAFVATEARVAEPLIPLRMFRLRNLTSASVIGVLWAAAMFAWFFLTALYLQFTLGYSPLRTGLAFLPANLVMGVLSAGFTPVLLAATGDVPPRESGLASGLINTAFMLGGALGLAILASLASGRTRHLVAAGHAQAAALTSGYHVAFLVGGICAALAALLAAALLRSRTISQASSTPAPAPADPASVGARA